MFTIELTLKGTPIALSVQRKEADKAEALYRQILKAMNSNSPQILELTCDREPEKKIGVLGSEISAVQISEKSSTAASGRAAGFFGLS
jgi:hypothetical protein